jgi:hypothetical protein
MLTTIELLKAFCQEKYGDNFILREIDMIGATIKLRGDLECDSWVEDDYREILLLDYITWAIQYVAKQSKD